MLRLGACSEVFLAFAVAYPVSAGDPPGGTTAGIIHKLEGHSSEIVSVAFSGTGREVYSASGDGQVCVWEAATGKQLRRLELKLEDELSRFMPRFPRGGRDTFVFIAPGGRFAAAAWNHRNFRLFDLRSGEEVCDFGEFSVHQLTMAFSPDGSLLAATHFNRQSDGISLRVWEVDSGKKVQQWTRPGMVAALAFSPDSKVLLCGESKGRTANMGSISLLDLSTGKEGSRFQSAAFGPLAFDGKRVVLRTENDLELWDAEQGKQIISIPYKNPLTSNPVFSPDGKTLAVGGGAAEGNDGVIQLWEVATAKIRREFSGENGAISSLAFSPDGKILASGIGKTAVLWNITATAK